MTEIRAADEQPYEDDPEEEEVDVDLDLIGDALRRESVGEPTTVRIDGTVIRITHSSDWASSAMRAATMGDWETWARAVIDDDKEFQAWLDADLRNFQIEAVFAQCARGARMNAGKSAKLSGSRRRTRKR
jgi:hypothetical protein